MPANLENTRYDHFKKKTIKKLSFMNLVLKSIHFITNVLQQERVLVDLCLPVLTIFVTY